MGAAQQETSFARIALTSLVASFANGGVIKDKGCRVTALVREALFPKFASLRGAVPGMHSRAARILLPSKKFHSLDMDFARNKRTNPAFFSMCKLEDEK